MLLAFPRDYNLSSKEDWKKTCDTMSSSKPPSKLPEYKVPENGLLSYLPQSLIPFAEPIRLDKLFGIYAGFASFLFGVLYSACIATPATPPITLPNQLLIFMIAVSILRSAAVAWNNVLDADFDRHVVRCRIRPVARGAVSLRDGSLVATAFTAAWLAFIYWKLPSGSMFYGVLYTFMHALYPLSKRFTA